MEGPPASSNLHTSNNDRYHVQILDKTDQSSQPKNLPELEEDEEEVFELRPTVRLQSK